MGDVGELGTRASVGLAYRVVIGASQSRRLAKGRAAQQLSPDVRRRRDLVACALRARALTWT